MAIQFRLESSNGFALAVNWELVVGSIESMGRMKIGLGSASTMITMWNVEGKRRLAIAWADGPRRSPLVKLILRTPTPLPGSDSPAFAQSRRKHCVRCLILHRRVESKGFVRQKTLRRNHLPWPMLFVCSPLALRNSATAARASLESASKRLA